MPTPSVRPRSSRPLAALLASSVAGLAAALSIFPGLSIRSAEGCSGASPWVDCGEPAWRSFALVRGDAAVPTDGILLTAVGPAASCANAPDPSALRIAAVAGDVTVAGSVSVVSSAPVTPGYLSSLTAHTLLWKPSAPLAPNASYALHVDAAVLDPGGAAGAAGANAGGAGGAAGANVGGASGGVGDAGGVNGGAAGAAGANGGAGGTGGTNGGGAGGVVPAAPIAFTTAAGPTGPLAAPADLTAVSTPTSVKTMACCLLKERDPFRCTNSLIDHCVEGATQSKPELTLSFAPSAAEAARPYLEYWVYDNSGEAGVPIFVAFGRESSGPYSYQRVFPDGGRHCLRIETRNLVTGQSISTDAPCPEPAAVDPAVAANCGALAEMIAVCSTPTYEVDATTRQLFDAHCEAPAPGTPGGGSGRPGAPVLRGDDDVALDDGCQVPAGLGSSSSQRAGLLVGLGALASLLRRSKKATD